MTETELKTLLSGITPPDEAARAAAHADHQRQHCGVYGVMPPSAKE